MVKAPPPMESVPRSADDRVTRTREALDYFGDLGAVLKAGRVSRGHDLGQVGAVLGMRADFVAAMEEGRLDRLPGGESYAPSMVVRYARFLGLEPGPLLEQMPGAVQVPIVSLTGARSRRGAWGRIGADETTSPLWIRFAGGSLVVVGLLLAALALS